MEGKTREYFDAVRRQAKIVEVRFGAKIEHAGLQAADMMAYETYKHILKEYEGRMLPIDDRRPDRRSLINLVGSRRISMEYFGPAKLAAIVARLGRQRASGSPGSVE
jgi:hypothetical protein